MKESAAKKNSVAGSPQQLRGSAIDSLIDQINLTTKNSEIEKDH